jgi:hypothetical protein
MEIVFHIPSKNESKTTKLTKSANTPKEGFEFAIKFCKEFALVTPLAFHLTPSPSPEERGEGVIDRQLYYYDDTDVDAYLNNQMSIEEFLEKNQCDALVRNIEVLVLSGEEIDAGSLFMVRGKYAYYISDYGIRILLEDLEYESII